MAANLINYLSLVMLTTSLAVGQVLFKHVGLAMRGRPINDGLFVVMLRPAFYGALAIYGVSTLLWIWILSRVPLMQAYPWVAAGTAIVPLLGRYFFGERIEPLFWLGVTLILAGIMITQYSIRSD